MFTFDRRTIDSSGAFLVGELERLDKTLHAPLSSVTWGRDIDLREDVTIADESSSFTLSNYAASGNPNPKGKNWIGGNATAIAGIALDINKVSPCTCGAWNSATPCPSLPPRNRSGGPSIRRSMKASN